MVLILERPASVTGLTAEEREVHEFVVTDRSNVDRFLDSLGVARQRGTSEALAAHLVRTDERLHAVYGRWLAMELVAGRVHTLERSYEAVLRSMLSINEQMKSALASADQDDAAKAMVSVAREDLRLSTRVGWTDRELRRLVLGEEGAA